MSQNIFELASVIEVLLSSDNNRRLEAERYVNEIPLTNFDQGIDGFLSCMHNENPHISSMSALLLKKKYLDSKNIFVMLSREKLETILHGTQECMKPDKPLQFLKRCCDILVKLYTFCDQKKELIGLIQSFCTSEEKNMKLALMYLIEIICEFAFDDNLLMQNSAALEGIFQRGLEDSANEIRVAAFKTLTIFLSSITDEKLVKRFNSVLEILLAKAIELIKFDQESGITALESFN